MTPANLLVISCGPDPSRYLIDFEWVSLIQELKTRVELIWATTVTEIVIKLRDSAPVGILVIDAGWTEDPHECRTTVGMLKRYAESGGIVLFAGVFPAVISVKAFRFVFPFFDVDWEFSGYESPVRSRLNPYAALFEPGGALAREVASMPSVVEMSQLTLRTKEADQVVYAPEELKTRLDPEKKIESGVLMAPLGSGYVGFVGDRENVATTKTVVLAMFNILC